MPIDRNDLASLRRWLRARRARSGDDLEHKRVLDELSRAQGNPEDMVMPLQRLVHLHDRRIEELEAIVAMLAAQLDESHRPPSASPADDPLRVPRGAPYRGAASSPPEPGTFTCRTCGRVLPSEEACMSADGRFCIDCFEPTPSSSD